MIYSKNQTGKKLSERPTLKTPQRYVQTVKRTASAGGICINWNQYIFKLCQIDKPSARLAGLLSRGRAAEAAGDRTGHVFSVSEFAEFVSIRGEDCEEVWVILKLSETHNIRTYQNCIESTKIRAEHPDGYAYCMSIGDQPT